MLEKEEIKRGGNWDLHRHEEEEARRGGEGSCFFSNGFGYLKVKQTFEVSLVMDSGVLWTHFAKKPCVCHFPRCSFLSRSPIHVARFIILGT